MNGALLLLWCAALSGWQIPRGAPVMLAVHLAGSAAGGVVVAVFLAGHFWPRRGHLAELSNARLGLASLAALVFLAFSGLALLIWTNVTPLRQAHAAAAAGVLALVILHGAWRLRQRKKAGDEPTAAGLSRFSGAGRILAAGVCASLGLAVAGFAAAGYAGGETFRSAFEPVQATAAVPVAHDSLSRAGLTAASFPSAGDCAACHPAVHAQWQQTAHAQAAVDVYYTALTEIFVQERGLEALRYCSACHAPLGLMAGEVNALAQNLDSEPGLNAEPGMLPPQNPAAQKAYQARALGASLRLSPSAAEGVTCAVCHRAAVSQEGGSFSLALQIATPPAALPQNTYGRLTLRSAPQEHARAYGGRETAGLPAGASVLTEARLCAPCHNLSSPEGRLLEPTYDEWLASEYPAEGKTCQACHFPPAALQKVSSGAVQPTAAHGGLPGAPSSLAGMANRPDLLETAARLELQLSGSQVWVTVENSGAGHYLPTGADDLRQVWLEVSLYSAFGELLWQSGGRDAYGMLDPQAARFGKTLGDENGRPVALHRFWVAVQVLEDTRLAPGEARRVLFSPPAEAFAGADRAVVRLLYQDVPADFASFALPGSPAPEPIVMAAAETRLP